LPLSGQTAQEDRRRRQAANPSSAFDVPLDTLRRRGRCGNEARSAAIRLTRRVTDAPGRQIGAYFGGVGPSTVSTVVAKVRQDRMRKRSPNARLIQTEAALRKKGTMKT